MCRGEQLSIHTTKVGPKKRIKKRKTRENAGKTDIEANDVCVCVSGSMRCLNNRSCRRTKSRVVVHKE